jgi:hypothetical protein
MMQHQQLNQRKYKFVAPQNFFKSQSDILMTSPITSPAFLELQRLRNLNFDASNRIYHRRRICITYIQHLQTEMIKCQEKKPRIICLWENPFTASYFEDLFWLLNGSQLSTSFCKQMTGSSMLKTGRQHVDHLVYHLICLCRSVFAKAALFKTQNPCNHFNWKLIDVNWYLSTNSSLSLSIDQSLVHTKWCKWTWKKNAF